MDDRWKSLKVESKALAKCRLKTLPAYLEAFRSPKANLKFPKRTFHEFRQGSVSMRGARRRACKTIYLLESM